MVVKNVFMLYNGFGFIEITRDTFLTLTAIKGFKILRCLNALRNTDLSWGQWIVYPAIFKADRVGHHLNRQYTKYTGIVG